MHGYDHPWAGGANNNKWDEVWELGGITADTGEDTPANDRIRSKNYTAVTPSADYYLSMSNYGAWIYCYDTNKDYISRFNQPAGASFTVPSNCYYIRFVTYAEYGTTYGDDIAINYPATVTTYSPYSNICPISGRTGTTVSTRNADNTETASATISFGQTVYGGQVDFKTGRVRVTHVCDTFTGADAEGWSINNHRFATTLQSSCGNTPSQIVCLSNIYEAKSASDIWSNRQTAGYVGIAAQTTNCYVVDNVHYSNYDNTDLASFKAALASNPLQVCYELATPVTIQLTPTQLKLLKGYNSVTGDGVITITAYTGSSYPVEITRKRKTKKKGGK